MTILNTAELLGKRLRLQAELARAEDRSPCDIGHVRRLNADIEATDRAIAQQRVVTASEAGGPSRRRVLVDAESERLLATL